MYFNSELKFLSWALWALSQVSLSGYAIHCVWNLGRDRLSLVSSRPLLCGEKSVPFGN